MKPVWETKHYKYNKTLSGENSPGRSPVPKDISIILYRSRLNMIWLRLKNKNILKLKLKKKTPLYSLIASYNQILLTKTYLSDKTM